MFPILAELDYGWKTRCDDTDHIIRKGQAVMAWILIGWFLNDRMLQDLGQIAQCRVLAQKSFSPLHSAHRNHTILW